MISVKYLKTELQYSIYCKLAFRTSLLREYKERFLLLCFYCEFYFIVISCVVYTQQEVFTAKFSIVSQFSMGKEKSALIIANRT